MYILPPLTSSVNMAYSYILLLLLCCVAFSSSSAPYPPLVPGLNYSFYQSSCPNLETLIRNYLTNAFQTDIGIAAGLLRIHFHDCFVQGCDGSVLLDGTASGRSEKSAPPNLTLRPAAFKAINDIKAIATQACGNVISCADITALAARDSVYLSGGPNYDVPLGRRDSLTFASQGTTLASLPPPSATASVLLSTFSKLNLDVDDLVALSGGHTIGIGHCTSFQDRLFPTQDPSMDTDFAEELYETCPAMNTANTTGMDYISPDTFDNMYFVDLMNGQGLFTSDQDLLSDMGTWSVVISFAMDQGYFFDKFVYSVTKMGQLSVLTGDQGEIRANCAVRNPAAAMAGSQSKLLSPVSSEEAKLINGA